MLLWRKFFPANFEIQFIDDLYGLFIFSGVYTTAETKGRQTLLRQRAILIADYEALHHIHFWNHEPEPKHIYYFGQSKHFEEWYNKRKDDQGAIYEEFEEKRTFTKHTFKESDYDESSIWVNNNDDNNIDDDDKNMKTSVKNFKSKSNEVSDNVEDLIKRIKEIEKIEEIEDVKIDLKVEVKKLQLKLEKLEKLSL